MRWIALLAAAVLLSACGGNICWHDPSGLDPAPLGSGIKTPFDG
jgi:hypothetical protein